MDYPTTVAPEAGGVQEIRTIVGPAGSAERLVGGLAPATTCNGGIS